LILQHSSRKDISILNNLNTPANTHILNEMGEMMVDDGGYCFLDLDLDNSRKKLATCAAFVDSTNLTYGFSSKDLLRCGGSEISRLKELISTDHEWSSKGDIITQPPSEGNRIVIKLYWDVAPMASENFMTLCSNGSISDKPDTGNKKVEKVKPIPIGESGKPLSYRGCKVHRIIPGFVLQSGDFVLENGSGGECVFKNKKIFKDERAGLNLKHDRCGLLR
jgi:cyclophilin family peptidyl-prolyl cis-trans isomerase